MKKIMLFCLIGTSGCATQPAFRKSGNDQPGYSVKHSDRKDIFDITAPLPGAKDPFRDDYLVRAAGEECLAAGFLFFDVGLVNEFTMRAFCYSAPKHKSLGVLFDVKAARGHAPLLRVADTLMGSHSPLRPWDEVRKVGGQAVSSIADFKEQIFRQALIGKSEVTVSVTRSEIPLAFEARFMDPDEASFNPESLEALRVRIP